jgi:hypothetical protein
MTRPLLLLIILFAMGAVPVLAQPQTLRPADIDALFTAEPRVEVNVSGPLLRLVAEITRDEDAQFADMLRGLRGVHVRKYALSAARSDIHGRVAGFTQTLQRAGWETLVRVREPGQDVTILLRPSNNVLDGLVVMVLKRDGDEAVFVTIDGVIDPSQIGRLGRQFNVPALEQAGARSR